MIFAEEFTPPQGMSMLLSQLMYGAVFIVAISHLVKMWLPKPPLDKQIESLKEWVAKWFATKDDVDHASELAAERISTLGKATEQLIREVRENERTHEERSVALHNRINELLVKYGEMKGMSMRHSQPLRAGGAS